MKRMTALGINDRDLDEKFIRGSGHGGQKINKTSSCVYLKHAPSGIEIKCQAERSRALNRFLARHELCDQLEARQRKAEQLRKQRIAKRRRQNRKRSAAQKKQILADKRLQSRKKKLRTKPGLEE